MQTLEDIIEIEAPHEITIYEFENSKPLVYEEDTCDFLSDFCLKHPEILERKVKDWSMTMERFMTVHLDEELIEVDYETIGAVQQRKLKKLTELNNLLNEKEYEDIINVYKKLIDRLIN